jgi:hypothetical protein
MIYPLGRNRSKFDARDYSLSAFMPRKGANAFVAPDTRWEFALPTLNQGDTGHCVGFSMADWGICFPVQDAFTNANGHSFYYKCKIVDGEPEQENGSTVRSAATVLRQEGMIDAYAFASSVNEIKYWLVNKGPLIIGTDWTNDMFTPDSENVIHPTGDVAGGHAYLINEVKDDALFGIQNSWGNEWGIMGRAYIPISEFSVLFRYGGEALAAVEKVNGVPQPPKPNGCFAAFLGMFRKI